MTAFAQEGYSLNSSFRTTAKSQVRDPRRMGVIKLTKAASGKDTLIFLRDEPDPDAIFFAVAFHSSDRVWIIDAEADVGQHLEEGIRNWWLEGIRDARVRERHCREIRLRGSPCELFCAVAVHTAKSKLATRSDWVQGPRTTPRL